MAPTCPLLLLPPELSSRLCLFLPTASICSLEATSSQLSKQLARAGVWRERIKRINTAKQYSFITRVMNHPLQHKMVGQKVYKVILGVRAAIKQAGYDYNQQVADHQSRFYQFCISAPSALPEAEIYREGPGDIFHTALHRLVSTKMSQIKAWSRDMLADQADYEGLKNHERFCKRVFGDESEIDVGQVIEKMKLKAQRRFVFCYEDEAIRLKMQCEAIRISLLSL